MVRDQLLNYNSHAQGKIMDKKSVNKVILIGNIGNMPEGRYTSSGIAITSFSLATNETWLNAENEKINNTEWHNIIAWNKLAEFANEYLFKGQSIYLEGKIRTSYWEDEKSGQKRSKVEIVCSNIIPLEWKKNNKSDENHK